LNSQIRALKKYFRCKTLIFSSKSMKSGWTHTKKAIFVNRSFFPLLCNFWRDGRGGVLSIFLFIGSPSTKGLNFKLN
jgi:hypothetical protein